MCSEEVRSPLLPPTERVQEAIRAAMRHAGLIN
jgi:4-hydroxy-tetrahydrodipicolinate synthase